MIFPKKIFVKKNGLLEITWNNGKIHNYPLQYLRDEAPDAGNKGETILWRHYEAPEKGPDKPGKYEIEAINKVGNYGISILWKDGNQDAIYSWDLLLEWGERFEIDDILPPKCEHFEPK